LSFTLSEHYQAVRQFSQARRRRQPAAFASPAKMACRAGNRRVLCEAACLRWDDGRMAGRVGNRREPR